jgi:hypothetical protein
VARGEVFEAAALVELDELGGDLLLVGEVGGLGDPVVSLQVKEADEIKKVRLARAVVEAEHGEGFVLPAELSPVAERAGGERGELVAEVLVHEREDARVLIPLSGGGLVVLSEGFEDDDTRPPVVIGGGADHAAGLLVGEGPVDVLLGFGFEAGVVEEPGEGDEAVEEVRAALPGLAGAAEPAGVGADVCPGFVEMAGEAVGLDAELVSEPACGLDRAEREEGEGAGMERGTRTDGGQRGGFSESGEAAGGKSRRDSGKARLLEEATARRMRHLEPLNSGQSMLANRSGKRR